MAGYSNEDLINKFRMSMRYNFLDDTPITDEVLTRFIKEVQQDVAEQVYNVGHNLDCMFCGFKDKLANNYIPKFIETESPLTIGGDTATSLEEALDKLEKNG